MPAPASIPLVRAVTPLLDTARFGRTMEGYATIGSTNERAAAWAAEGAPEGSVVAAEYQTAGRGRLGRAWHAEPGQNLMFSTVLRPALPADRFGLIPLAAAVAVADTLDDFAAPLRATIKWPNDVRLRGRKCCGILLASSLSGSKKDAPGVVVLGIGLNVNQDQFPEALSDRATSLKQAARRPIERPRLFAALLRRLEQRYDTLFADGGRAVRAAYQARLDGLHEPVTLHTTDAARPVRGVVRGISDAGALRLETNDGLQTFHAGELTSHS